MDRLTRDAPGDDWRPDWRPLPGYFGVWVSRDGRVWFPGTPWSRIRSSAMRPQTENAYGYLTVCIWSSTHLVHRLVMYAFVGPCPDGHEIDHINGDTRDNRLSNLEYVTRQENERRMWARRRTT